jgi:hypothetical protein
LPSLFLNKIFPEIRFSHPIGRILCPIKLFLLFREHFKTGAGKLKSTVYRLGSEVESEGTNGLPIPLVELDSGVLALARRIATWSLVAAAVALAASLCAIAAIVPSNIWTSSVLDRAQMLRSW